jgi:hypothetical protein
MATAMMYPEPEKTYPGRKSQQRKVSDNLRPFNPNYLAQARAILRSSPELAEEGATP